MCCRSSDEAQSSDLAPFTFMIDGKLVESMFTTREPVCHKALKSAVASKYSLSSMLQLEPLFDKCTPVFVTEKDKRAGLAIDFGSWCSWSNPGCPVSYRSLSCLSQVFV